MPYIQKHVLEKAGGDPLLEYFLGPSSDLNQMLNESGGATIRLYRSKDRSYVESHNAWESRQAYEAWLLKHGDKYITQLRDVEEYMAKIGIIYKRYDPAEKDWDSPSYFFSFTGTRVTEADRVTFEQIFE
jgi:heme-degrading monooxygenase HmoA